MNMHTSSPSQRIICERAIMDTWNTYKYVHFVFMVLVIRRVGHTIFYHWSIRNACLTEGRKFRTKAAYSVKKKNSVSHIVGPVDWLRAPYHTLQKCTAQEAYQMFFVVKFNYPWWWF
jgi:hypothetical protein